MSSFSQPERHGLERLQVPEPASHPDADLLTAFAEHSLTAREQEEVFGHLAACVNCREVVALAGAPLAEAIHEPVRRRRPWEMPLFRWGAVAATVVVVAGAVTLGVYDRPVAHLDAITREAPPLSNADQVIISPASKPDTHASEGTAKSAAPVSTRRAIHLQQQVRFERPASAPQEGKAKKQEQLAGGLPLDRKDARGGAAGALNVAPTPPPPPPPPARDVNAASTDEAFTVSQNAPMNARNVSALADISSGVVAGQKTETEKLEKKTSAAAKPQSPSGSQYAVNANANNVAAFAASETVQVTAAAPQLAPPAPPQQSVLMDKVQANGARAMFHEVRPIESNITGTEWQITREGELQRSFSRGSLWETMLKGKQFRSVAVVRDHIWAGGDDGALYYSSDNGRTWNPIAVRDANVAVTGNVVNLRFDDQQNGSLETSTGETWKTNDGGQTWHKQH